MELVRQKQGHLHLDISQEVSKMETAWGRIPVNGPGGDVDVKSGSSTSPKKIEAQVDFSASFGSVPTIVLTPKQNKGVWITEVNIAYFKWNNDSNNVDVTVHWIALGVI